MKIKLPLLIIIILSIGGFYFYDDFKLWQLRGKVLNVGQLKDFQSNSIGLEKYYDHESLLMVQRFDEISSSDEIIKMQKLINKSAITTDNSVLIISLKKEQLQNLIQFVDKNEISLPIILDFEDKVLGYLEQNSPLVLILDHEGKIKKADRKIEEDFAVP